MDPLKPDAGLLCKLGSVLVHVDEMLSAEKGHAFDHIAMESLMRDADVKTWLRAMDKLALLPKRR